MISYYTYLYVHHPQNEPLFAVKYEYMRIIMRFRIFVAYICVICDCSEDCSETKLYIPIKRKLHRGEIQRSAIVGNCIDLNIKFVI